MSPHFAFPAFTNSIMELPRMSLWAIWSFLLVSSIHLPCFFGSAPHFSNETDLLALLKFKHLITDDPLHSLTSWNHTLHFCHWQGVTCAGPRHPQRVRALDLIGQKLVGSISPYIANLTFLRMIDLSDNSFYGTIPEEIGQLFRLRYLALINNTFTGEIPANLSYCFKLQALGLYGNRLVGRIPTELGSLSKLTELSLGDNSLTGSIPPSLGNLSSLWYLYLSENKLSGTIPEEIGRLFRLRYLALTNNTFTGEIPANLSYCFKLQALRLSGNQLTGRIPSELGSLSKLTYLRLGRNSLAGSIPPLLGNLSSLTYLYLSKNSLEGSIPDDLCQLVSLHFLGISENKLSGTIPPRLYNISSIVILDVAFNRFHGNLPPNIGLTLPNLQRLYAEENQFTGPIPVSLSNASGLLLMELANNSFSGSIPLNFGSLKGLTWLNLWGNELGIGKARDLSFLDSLTNCSRLQLVHVGGNRLSGAFPNSIANLSTQLTFLSLRSNMIFGSIPSGILNLIGLTVLNMENNFLTGTIPIGVGKLNKLEVLYLHSNGLTGKIPPSLGNITRLYQLYLQENNLSGSIPSTLGNCTRLNFILLFNNNFSGTLPNQLFSIPSLIEVQAGNNFFANLPHEASYLQALGTFNVSNNKLSGEIPSWLGNCLSLEYLRLDGNFFQGSIPSTFSTLKGLRSLDLSRNNLSGKIPRYLEKFALEYLNLSFNNFEGELPKQGVFGNASRVSVLGNSKLCGGIHELQLPPCSSQASKNRGISLASKVKFSIIGAVLGLISLSCFFTILYRVRKSRRKPFAVPSMEAPFMNVSYAELFKATDEFSPPNLIGTGSFGAVYKGFLDRVGTMVAVKVFNLQQQGALRSFMAECEALRNIRHRNLVKILTCCSSIDFKGNDFKALVYEYMSNGSLEKWLHREGHDQPRRNLKFTERINIAIDVASALDYLHNHCQTSIIHQDLKPSNILLDDDMIAHVGDFGLARFLSEVAQSSSVGMKGSIGYIAPEYAMGGKASTQGDVYSYGILLLEMITGKGPTDDVFKENLTLHHFAKMGLAERVMEIVDPQLLLEEAEAIQGNKNKINSRNRMHDCLISMVKIGVLCSTESPSKRMQMRDVVAEIHTIKDLYLGVKIH